MSTGSRPKTVRAAKWAAFDRRAAVFRRMYNMKWTGDQQITFNDRCMLMARIEGIDDLDLRTLVRMYNREIAKG